MRRVILLGASNLRMGLNAVLKSLTSACVDPMHLFLVGGHGRSYGQWSYIPFRGLPGITQCEVWDALDAFESSHTPLALVTDVGNDLLFHVEATQLLDWVELCLARLRRLEAQIVMTLPPWERLKRLSSLRYRATRTLFFPGSRLTWPEMLERVEIVRSGLQSLGDRYGAAIIDPPLAWYGIDPIHLRRSRRVDAFGTMFRGWPDLAASTAEAAPSPKRRLPRLSWAKPSHRKFFGREERTPQPVWTGERLAVSLY